MRSTDPGGATRPWRSSVDSERGVTTKRRLGMSVGAWEICSGLESVATTESRREESGMAAWPLPVPTSHARRRRGGLLMR
ncbi:hypothetical protein HPP92_021147 [Vanilla planifolia]|uniref:Uncharacterized protein n=1 Tax=Vanilla planifolia TaxID=51239 RepID=A0A835PV25_VANPL|nr:hypothetical protein HPP92_021147 [Vanilla planifolia]